MTASDEFDTPDRRPIPDPTKLTTEQLYREIASLGALVRAEFQGAVDQIHEKFEGVEQQLSSVERHRVEQKVDTKTAVDAALAAAKEAVGQQTEASERAIAKSEAATTKQLEQLMTTFTTAMAGLTMRVDDLKDRVARIESQKVGGQQAYAGLYALAGLLVLLLAVGGFVVALRP